MDGFPVSSNLFDSEEDSHGKLTKKDQVGGKRAQLTSIDFGLHRVLVCPNLIYVKQSATNPPPDERIRQQWIEMTV